MLFRLLRNRKGFTMIEMMVVLIIIGVLIAGGVWLYSGYIENARVTKAKSYISTVQAGLDAYYAENSDYPDTLDELREAGISATGTTLPFALDAKDPWGKNYEYNYAAASGGSPAKYVVYSGHDKVQKKDNTYVVGRGSGGTSGSLKLETTSSGEPTP